VRVAQSSSSTSVPSRSFQKSRGRLSIARRVRDHRASYVFDMNSTVPFPALFNRSSKSCSRTSESSVTQVVVSFGGWTCVSLVGGAPVACSLVGSEER